MNKCILNFPFIYNIINYLITSIYFINLIFNMKNLLALYIIIIIIISSLFINLNDNMLTDN